VARHIADAIQYGKIADALVLQPLDEAIARARRRHADAREAMLVHGPTHVRTLSSAA
jgi:hypothetical protein